MNKLRVLFGFIIVTFFFWFTGNIVRAEAIVVSDFPTASDIYYGQPLFESRLSGGYGNVDGTFRWVNENVVREVGEYSEKVIFIPNDSEYGEVELEVVVRVNPRRVYIEFERDLYKQFDEKDSLKLPNYVVKGIIDDDVFVSGNLIGKLESIFVGQDITVNLSGIELKGAKKDNYYLDLENHKAVVYPVSVEKRSEHVSNKITLGSDIFIPLNSSIQIREKSVTLEKKGYVLNNMYDIYIDSKGTRIDVDGYVVVKLHMDQSRMSYEKIKLFNYYNGKYEELDYVYEDGYLTYSCTGLGILVIAQKEVSYVWLYVLIGIVLLVVIVVVFCLLFKKRKKISKYKSKSRRKDHGNYW